MNTTMAISDAFPVADQKPLDAVTVLMDAVSSGLPRLHIKRGEIVKYTTEKGQHCIVLHKGSVAVHRRGDGMIITSEQAPFVFGLDNQHGAEDTMYLRTLEECEVSVLPAAQVNETVTSENLWQIIVKIVLYTTSKVFEHCSQIHQMSAYDIIRYQLYELSKESETVRLNTTVAKYIKSRTYLSRSGIMRILSELRIGQYIQIEKGILTRITNLPKKY